MRSREDIAKDSIRKEDLIIEVLLDIRELLSKPSLPIVERKKGKRKYTRKVLGADSKRLLKNSV